MLFRVKVVVALALVCLAAAGILHHQVSDQIERETTAALQTKLAIARESLKRVRRLHGYAIVAKAEEVARAQQIGKILSLEPETFADPEGKLPDDDEYRYQVHRRMNEEVLVWAETFRALGEDQTRARETLADWRHEQPDLFMVIDSGGVGVARTRDRAWFGPETANVARQHPSIGPVVAEGKVLKDIWIVKGSPMNVAAAPVRHDGKVVGAVIIGYRLTDQEARRDKEIVQTEVAYFLGQRLAQSSTLGNLEENMLQEIVTEQKLYEVGEGRGQTVEFVLNTRRYLAAVGYMAGNPSAPRAGYVVFEDYDAALKSASEVLILIPATLVVAMLLLIGLFIGFYRQFLGGFEEIDNGVAEIINGNLDYWFEIDSKELPGTMSQNLNIMVCQLSGRPLPEENDGLAAESWSEDRMFIEALDASQFRTKPIESSQIDKDAIGIPSTVDSTSGLSPDVLQLVREDAETYYRRTFREYTDARRHTGESLQGLSFSKFSKQIESRAEALREKYRCTQVRFLVQVRDGRVSLKPVPIN